MDISAKVVINSDISMDRLPYLTIIYKYTNNMHTSTIKLKKVVVPSATLREMSAGMTVRIPTKEIKTSILRMTASKLKKKGYLFRVSDKGLTNETIVECIKTPEL